MLWMRKYIEKKRKSVRGLNMILNESDLRRLVREMLSEMSRERKLAFRDEYGHPGMVKHALYTHWFQGLINEPTIYEFEKTSSGKSIKERVEAWKNFCIRFFEDSINYIDGNYVRNLFLEEDFDIDFMVHKVQNGFNLNEVKLISKNLRKKGFFEKFFQLFS